MNKQKFLDESGVVHLYNKLSLQDYPNNETLIGVITAIDETKADKSELFSGSWNDLVDRPFYDELEIVLTIAEHQELTFNKTFYTQTPAAQVSVVNPAEYYNNFPAGKYLIIFDGKHYVLDGINAGISGPPVNFLGNASLAVGEIKNDITYEDNGIPFLVLHQVGGRGWCVYTTDTSVAHTIEIHKVEGELKKIDDKFISDSIARSADVESAFNTLENEINTLAPVAHSNSWNDLNDKPTEFIGRTIIYGRTSVNNTPSASMWYYVSNKTPTLEEFAYGCKLVRTTGEIIKEFTIDDITLGKFLSSSETNNICGQSYFYILPQDTYISQSLGTLPAGTYFAPIDADGNIQQTSRDISYNLIINGREVIKDEHIPDTIARVSDIPNQLHPIAKSGSWDLIENKPLNHIPKATISKPNGSFVSIHLDDFVLLSGVMPTLEDFSEGYDVITNYPVETVHYDSSTILTGDYFDSGFYNVYDSNGQFIIFYEDGKLSDGRDVEKGTYLNTNLITSLIVKPQTVLDPVQIKVDWDGIINKPDNFAFKEDFHKIAQSGSWNDLEDKPFDKERQNVEVTVLEAKPLEWSNEYAPSENIYIAHPDYNITDYIIIGSDIIVNFEGEEYVLQYRGFVGDLELNSCWGNVSLRDSSYEDTGEPFLICGEGRFDELTIGSDEIIYSVYTNISDIVEYGYVISAKMTKDIDIFKTIDSNFIGSDIARVTDIENIDLTPYETKTDAQSKLEEAKAFASEEDAKVQGAVDALSSKVTTLIGEDANKSIRTIANEELAKQLIAESAKESLDTLTEIAAWIQSHPDDASAMNEAISNLEALVGTLPDGVSATTIVGYIQEVVAANKALIDANTEAIDALHTVAKTGSWNDLEDKPFGNILYTTIDTIIPEQQITIGGYDTTSIVFDKTLILGEIYTVVINGVSHEIECTYNDEYGPQHQLVVSDDLRIYQEVGMNYLTIINLLEEPTHITLSITGPYNVLSTLDSKFIGDDIARVADQSILEERVAVVESEVDTLATVARTGSWNDLTNKPTEFTGTYTIKGPSNVNELIPTYASFYKISDEPLTLENFANGYSFKASHESQATFYSADNLIVGDLFWPGSYGIMHPGQTFFSVLKDSEYGSNTLPRGLYFLKTTNLEHELTIYSNEILKENILPMEYLHNYTQNLIDENRLYGDFKTGGDYIYITSDNIKINNDYIYVGPYTPTQEELTKGTYIFRIGTGSYPVYRIDYDNTIFTLSNGFRLDCVYVITTPDATFPYIGIYILDQDVSNQVYMLRINGYKKFPYTKYIDNKYLKDKDGKIIYTKTKCIYETTALGLVSPYSTIQKSEMLDFNDYDKLDYKIIEVDGVDYLLEPRYRSSSDEHFLIGDIGYIALGYGGTGSGYNFYYYVLFENGEHSFAIYDTEVSYEVINEKLIPDTIARVSDIPDLSTYELITTADIDSICGASIVAASEVTF